MKKILIAAVIVFVLAGFITYYIYDQFEETNYSTNELEAAIPSYAAVSQQ